MVKRKQFNLDNVRVALQLLQPVTPMDKDHPAEYWNDGTGLVIKSRQEMHIDLLKNNIMKGETKEDIQSIRNLVSESSYSFDSFVNQCTDSLFWSTGFGDLILEKWDEMIGRFVQEINNLE